MDPTYAFDIQWTVLSYPTGEPNRPQFTSVPPHLYVYGAREEVNGVVHAHPPTATAYATAGRTLPDDLLTEMTMGLGDAPLVEHGVPGSMTAPDALGPVIHTADVFLTAYHGTLTIGADVHEACSRMESVEFCAHTIFMAEQLGAKPLSHEKVAELRRVRQERLAADDN